MDQRTLNRRTIIKGGIYAVGSLAALDLMAACTPGGSATPPATAPTASTAEDADVQQAYDSFVKKEMPGVPIDLVRAAKREGSLSAYTLVVGFNKPVLKAFQQKFPFVQIEHTELNGGVLFNRFLAESKANQNNADVIQSASTSDVKTMVDQGLALNYTPTVEGEFIMDHATPGYTVPVCADSFTFAYNSQQFTDSDDASLKNWDGLFDTRWDGKRLAVVEVLAGGSTQLLNYYFFKRYGTRLWERIAKNPHAIFPSGNPSLDSIISGETDLFVGGTSGQGAAKMLAGAPLRWTNPQDWLFTLYLHFIAAKAPHPNVAKLFQEFVLSSAGQQMYDDFGSHSLRKGFKGTADFYKESWYQPIDSAKRWQYDDKDLAAAIPDISKQWRSIIK